MMRLYRSALVAVLDEPFVPFVVIRPFSCSFPHLSSPWLLPYVGGWFVPCDW